MVGKGPRSSSRPRDVSWAKAPRRSPGHPTRSRSPAASLSTRRLRPLGVRWDRSASSCMRSRRPARPQRKEHREGIGGEHRARPAVRVVQLRSSVSAACAAATACHRRIGAGIGAADAGAPGLGDGAVGAPGPTAALGRRSVLIAGTIFAYARTGCQVGVSESQPQRRVGRESHGSRPSSEMHAGVRGPDPVERG